MKVGYPNLLKKDKYIAVLASKYFLEYESYGFNLEQIKAPIKYIINCLDFEINRCSEEKWLEPLVVNKCNLIFSNPSDINEDCLSQSFITIFCYFKSKEASIRYTVTDRAGIPFPEEHKEKYLEFISIMTKTVVNEIIACTLSYSPIDTEKSDNNKSLLQHETFFRGINNQDPQCSQLEMINPSSST